MERARPKMNAHKTENKTTVTVNVYLHRGTGRSVVGCCHMCFICETFKFILERQRSHTHTHKTETVPFSYYFLLFLPF